MLCASVLSASIGGLVLYQSSQVVEENVYRNLANTAEKYAGSFSKSTEKVEATLDSYLSAMKGTLDFQALFSNPDLYLKQYQDQTLVPLTKQFAADNLNHFLGIYFDFDPSLPKNLKPDDQTYGVWYLDKNLTGTAARNQMELKKNFYPENDEMGWYYEATKAKKGVWSKPYVDIYTGYYMISYNVPLYYQGKLIGVAGIDMTFESVKKIIETFKVLDTGYAFLLSSDYDVLVTPGSKVIAGNTKLTNLNPDYRKLIDVIQKGTSKTAFIGKASSGKVLSYGKMSNGYLFVIEVRSEEIFKDLNYIRALIDTMILLGIILCAVVAYFLGKYIAKPVDEAQRKIHKLYCMDLQKDFHAAKFRKNSEGRKMLEEIEAIRETVEKLVLSLKENLSQEELTQEKLEAAANKLEVPLSRMQRGMEGGSVLKEFQKEESSRLFDQITELLRTLSSIRKRNEKLCGTYYLDENSVRKQEKEKTEGS